MDIVVGGEGNDIVSIVIEQTIMTLVSFILNGFPKCGHISCVNNLSFIFGQTVKIRCFKL